MGNNKSTPAKSNRGKIVIAVLVVLVILYFVVSGVVNSKAEERVEEFVEEIEQESDGEIIIGYDGVEASLFTASATLDGLTVSDRDQGEIFRAGSVSVLMEGYVENERLPDTFGLAVDDLQVINEELLARMASFADIDYRDHPVDLRFGYNYSEGDNQFDTSLIWVTEDLSELTYEMTLSNVAGAWEAFQSAYEENQGDPELSRQQRQAIQQELQAVRFNGTRLQYRNEGEVELILASAARRQGVTADQLRSRIRDMADQQLGDSEAARNIRAFLENPEQISLTVEPEQPLTMEQLTQTIMMVMMGASTEAVRTLGLEVEAN